MAKDVERKFLVKLDAWSLSSKTKRYGSKL